MMSRRTGSVAAVGVGYSPIVRRSSRTLAEITLVACRNAIADAGLRPRDIDGLATYPEIPHFGSPNQDGIDIVSVQYVARMLGLQSTLRWHTQTDDLIVNTLIQAVNAVAAGACDYALVFRAMHNPGGAYNAYTSALAPGAAQFTAPYGVHRGYQYFGSSYRRYMDLYGATREHMATLIVNNRANAALNENAYFRDSPLTREDYLNARMLTDAVSLLDCDIPVDGGAAIVLTSSERARDLPNAPAYVAGFGQWSAQGRYLGPPLASLMADGRNIAKHLWESAGLAPRDVDVAQLYDGYSYFVYWWLEALGFCPEGEAFRFIQDGRIARDGELPVNTFGGQLGEGRLHGMGHLCEAVRQAAGRAGARQIPSARVSLATVGPLGAGSAGVIFTREPI